MKVLAVTLLTLVAVSYAKHINLEDVIDLEEITAYGYHTKVGGPLAEKIRKAEEEATRNPTRTGPFPAILGQFPYQAGLIIDINGWSGVCGGALLNMRRILTAAHCWFDGHNQASGITVILGTINLFSGGTRVISDSVSMHGSWNPNLARNDIAIINLPYAVFPSNTIGFVSLPAINDLQNSFTATIIGYGRTASGGMLYRDLHFAEVPVITNSECQNSFPGLVQPSSICISGASGISACTSDAGGPLVVNNNDSHILMGVHSFGHIQGCRSGHPVAYTRVTSYISWIVSHL